MARGYFGMGRKTKSADPFEKKCRAVFRSIPFWIRVPFILFVLATGVAQLLFAYGFYRFVVWNTAPY